MSENETYTFKIANVTELPSFRTNQTSTYLSGDFLSSEPVTFTATLMPIEYTKKEFIKKLKSLGIPKNSACVLVKYYQKRYGILTQGMIAGLQSFWQDLGGY